MVTRNQHGVSLHSSKSIRWYMCRPNDIEDLTYFDFTRYWKPCRGNHPFAIKFLDNETESEAHFTVNNRDNINLSCIDPLLELRALLLTVLSSTCCDHFLSSSAGLYHTSSRCFRRMDLHLDAFAHGPLVASLATPLLTCPMVWLSTTETQF